MDPNGKCKLEQWRLQSCRENNGWKDKQCERGPPNHLDQESTGRSHAGGHWQTPTHAGQDLKAKTANFEPEHADPDFLQWKLPPLHPNMFVRRDAK